MQFTTVWSKVHTIMFRDCTCEEHTATLWAQVDIYMSNGYVIHELMSPGYGLENSSKVVFNSGRS